jgi:hypothetical protein
VCLADGSAPGEWGDACGSKGAFNCGRGLTCKLRLPGAMDAGGKCISDGTIRGENGARCDDQGGYVCRTGLSCVRTRESTTSKRCSST